MSGKPLDKAIWQGRVDNEEDGDTRRWHQHIAAWFSGAAPGVALIGFACDAGVRRNHGRPGASQGPAGIRRALANLAWHGRLPAYDAGDVVVASSDADPGDLEAGQNTLAQEVSTLLDEGQRVLVLGGGHEVAFASHMGIRRHLANQRQTGLLLDLVILQQLDATRSARHDVDDPLAGQCLEVLFGGIR